MGVTEPICKVLKWLGKEGKFRPSPPPRHLRQRHIAVWRIFQFLNH
jgi:hypothetical protein